MKLFRTILVASTLFLFSSCKKDNVTINPYVPDLKANEKITPVITVLDINSTNGMSCCVKDSSLRILRILENRIQVDTIVNNITLYFVKATTTQILDITKILDSTIIVNPRKTISGYITPFITAQPYSNFINNAGPDMFVQPYALPIKFPFNSPSTNVKYGVFIKVGVAYSNSYGGGGIYYFAL